MELLSQHSVSSLRDALRRREPIVYRENGNRSAPAEATARRLAEVAPRIGIQRVARIGRLSAFGFPVFQSTRPGVLHHGTLGTNTGSQGKGRTELQARVSCIMESIEMFCAEPRAARLVRGSHASLRGQHPILDPRRMFRRYGAPPPEEDEPLMWTWALHLGSGREILVPAERVYFYFPAGTYRTRAVFPMGTSGLGAGATHLEATTHAIYELAERMYHGLAQRGLARVDCLWEEEVQTLPLAELVAGYGDEYELQLYTVTRAEHEDLPMITAMLVGDEQAYVGHGCAGDVDTAIARAVSEALQSFATVVSGSREDIGRGSDAAERAELEVERPSFRNLRVQEYRRRVHDRRFDDLRDELGFLVGWLERIGHGDVCIANLTRHGIDVPVVRVIVPGMPMERAAQCLHRTRALSDDAIAALRHPGTEAVVR